jgi:hypothetical protein
VVIQCPSVLPGDRLNFWLTNYGSNHYLSVSDITFDNVPIAVTFGSFNPPAASVSFARCKFLGTANTTAVYLDFDSTHDVPNYDRHLSDYDAVFDSCLWQDNGAGYDAFALLPRSMPVSLHLPAIGLTALYVVYSALYMQSPYFGPRDWYTRQYAGHLRVNILHSVIDRQTLSPLNNSNTNTVGVIESYAAVLNISHTTMSNWNASAANGWYKGIGILFATGHLDSAIQVALTIHESMMVEINAHGMLVVSSSWRRFDAPQRSELLADEDELVRACVQSACTRSAPRDCCEVYSRTGTPSPVPGRT